MPLYKLSKKYKISFNKLKKFFGFLKKEYRKDPFIDAREIISKAYYFINRK